MTMTLDDLRTKLQSHESRAAEGVRLDPSVLRARASRGAGGALGRARAWLVVEAGLNGLAALWLGSFLGDHLAEPRFVVAAAPLLAVAVAHVAFGVSQLVALGGLDLGGPVVAVQRRLEELRRGRIRVTKWTLLTGPLLWIPLLLVVLEGFFGIDGYAALDRAWLESNVAFGVAFVPVAAWASARLGDRLRGTAFAARLLGDVGGRNLAAAESFLAELAALEEEGRS
jgi:hypothetical protein